MRITLTDPKRENNSLRRFCCRDEKQKQAVPQIKCLSGLRGQSDYRFRSEQKRTHPDPQLRIRFHAVEQTSEQLAAVDANVELVRSAYERFNAGERDPDPALWHAQVEYVPDRLDPEPATHHGIGAVMKIFRSWADAYPDLCVEPVDIRAEGNRVFAWVHFSGHGAESGVPIDMERAQVFTLEHSQIVRAEEFFDRTEALHAAGLLQ